MSLWLQIFQFTLSGLTTGSTYALVAIGFSLIHNATGIVNFAQGEFVMLGGMFMITFYSFLRLPMVPAFVLTLFCVAAIGLLLERGPIHRARSKEILILVMVTVGASISIKGLSMMIWGKNPMTLPPFSGENPLLFLGAAVMPQSIWIFGITLSAVIALSYFFRGTMAGKAMRGEIDAVLGQHPMVQSSVVVVQKDTPGDKRLVAYVVTADSATISNHDLRTYLQHKLPDYMVPLAFVFLDSLPLTPNGKLDRNALPAPDQSRPDLEDAFAAPRTPIEEIVSLTSGPRFSNSTESAF